MSTIKDKKIVIVGGGAIGGMSAALMNENGYNVIIYDTDKAHVDSINKNGLSIELLKGSKNYKLKATSNLTDSYDIVFLAVKGNHTREALKTVIPHLKKNSLIVSLQNGINEEIISEYVGKERTIGAVIGWGCTNIGPGHLKQTSEGDFIIGTLNGKITEELKEIKIILETITTTNISTNIIGHLWTKLIANCAIAPIGLIFKSEVKELVTDRRMRAIALSLTKELLNVARAADISLENFEGLLDINLLYVDNFEDYKRSASILKIAGEKHKLIRSSMLQDFEKGRKTEIDFINGYIEKKAEEFGISTPINNKLINIVNQIDDGKIKPSYDLMDDFLTEVRIPKKWLEYEFDKDHLSSLSIMNLPDKIKHQQSSILIGGHLIGLSFAFSKGFEKITNSIFGKIFIRKSSWDITNLILSKYLINMGEKYAKNVFDSFKMDNKDLSNFVKISMLYLNTLNVNYSIEEFSKQNAKIKIDEDSNPYRSIAKNMNIDKKINFSLWKPIFDGLLSFFNNNISLSYEKINTDKEFFIINIQK